MAVAGMVLGIVALALSFIPCLGLLALIPGIVGIVLSAVGVAQSKKTGQGKGMGIAGLITAVIAVVWIPIYTFVVIPAAIVRTGEGIVKSAQEMQKSMENAAKQQQKK